MIQGKNPKEKLIIQTVYEAEQGHLFRWWEDLNAVSREKLLRQLERIDFLHLNRLRERCFDRIRKDWLKLNLEPPEIIPIPKTEMQKKAAEEARKIGEKFIQSGRLGIVVVAGGQGTRLGCEGPKGCYPVSPVKRKSLFQMHAEKILAESRAYDVTIPWYILTSESNEEATGSFFKQHRSLLMKNRRFDV